VAHGKPIHRIERVNDDAFSIIRQFQSEYQGLVEYYRKAIDLRRFNHLKWVMEQSLTKTLAHKMKISVPQVYKRYTTNVETPDGHRKVIRVVVPREGKKPLVATWGGVNLKRALKGRIEDTPPRVWNDSWNELLTRLRADTCELCGSTDRINVHHIRALRDLQTRGQNPRPEWVVKMASRQRKTLVVCHNCHYHDIHRHGTRGTVARS